MDVTLSSFYGIAHIPLHYLLPLLFYFRSSNSRQLFLLEAANLIDLDHLLANPVFAADRCSLTTHPLHGMIAGVAYVLLTAIPTTRYFGIGALIHLALDSPTCF